MIQAYTTDFAIGVQVMTPTGFGWLLRQQQEVQSGHLHCTGQVAVLQRPDGGRCSMPVDYHVQQSPWLGMTKPLYCVDCPDEVQGAVATSGEMIRYGCFVVTWSAI